MAMRLLDLRFSVDVWNRTPGSAARLAESGATAYTDAALAVAAADVVLTMLDLATAAAGTNVAPVAGTIAERWRRLVGQGYGRLDISAASLGLDGSWPQVREVA